MTMDVKIRDKKRKYDSYKEAEKILALSSSKSDEYEYLIGEEILPFDQNKLIQKAKFTYSPLGETYEKHK